MRLDDGFLLSSSSTTPSPSRLPPPLCTQKNKNSKKSGGGLVPVTRVIISTRQPLVISTADVRGGARRTVIAGKWRGRRGATVLVDAWWCGVVHEGLVARLLDVEVGLGEREGVGFLVRVFAVEEERVAGVERGEVVEIAHFLC